MNVAGKTIVVTGVASGIGAEVARQFQAAGARVIGMDRNEPSTPVEQFIKIDLSNPASIKAAADCVAEGIDGLCNVAGLPPTAPAEIVMAVNFLGLQALTDALVEKMSQGGSIVNVASLAGAGWPGATEQINSFLADASFDNISETCERLDIVGPRAYFFSKEVLICWTMKHRWSWRDRGIRMNCVSPGPVETPILADFIATLGERAEEDMRIMDRPGAPTDIAPVVQFLCSDESAWIRGANIPCDGGMFAHVQCQMNNLG